MQEALVLYPVRCNHHARPKPRDIETILRRMNIDRFLLTSEQVEQERAETTRVQRFPTAQLRELKRLLPLP